MGLWPPAESGQRVELPVVHAIEDGTASWHDVPTAQKMLMPIGLVIRCAAATTARAGRHRGARRNPGQATESTRATGRDQA